MNRTKLKSYMFIYWIIIFNIKHLKKIGVQRLFCINIHPILKEY